MGEERGESTRGEKGRGKKCGEAADRSLLKDMLLE